MMKPRKKAAAAAPDAVVTTDAAKPAMTMISTIECMVAVVLTLLVGCLHVRVLMFAGALWRDEVNSAVIAQAPSLAKFWQLLPFDSFPMMPDLMLRLWTAVWGGGDGALRVFGFLVGISVLAALWFNARTLGRSWPLISLAVFGMNVAALRSVDMIRGYGVGTLFILLALGLIWRLATAPNRLVVVLALLSTLAATQCLYQNAFLVLAICAGGMAVTIRQRLWKRTALILAIGGVAAVSLIPYVPVIRHGEQLVVLYQHQVGPEQLIKGLLDTLNSSSGFLPEVWVALLALGVVMAVTVQFPKAVRVSPAERDVALYSGIVMVVGLAGYAIFLKALKYSPQTYYFIPPLALAAVFFDAMAAVLPRVLLRRILILCLSMSVAIVSLPKGWTMSRARHTNLDRIAVTLQAAAAREDLIVIIPWYCGTTFQRYYKGVTPWITIPELDDFEIQREDLFKRKLATTNAAASALEKVSRTLQSGNKVWIVCQIEYDAKHLPKAVTSLRPAPQEPPGWYADPYLVMWAKQMWQLLEQHGRYVSAVMAPEPNAGQNENIPLIVYKGWK